jgi:hypothetical protein
VSTESIRSATIRVFEANRTLDAVAELLCDAVNGAGAWSNPGTLPDELDREWWRKLAADAAVLLLQPYMGGAKE